MHAAKGKTSRCDALSEVRCTFRAGFGVGWSGAKNVQRTPEGAMHGAKGKTSRCDALSEVRCTFRAGFGVGRSGAKNVQRTPEGAMHEAGAVRD